jgi:hypothetical protein
MINHHALAQPSTRMNFNARKKSRQMRNEPGQKGELMLMQPVSESVRRDRVQTRITTEHFERVGGSRIAPKNRGKILT